jgi:hypothetical protein|nr:MAG TPA: hypothetical protein [Caudoviricetes sp.]DAI89339.1 MAG TPA: hypothetical protein [Caudoviricetes sp.]DAQ91383.1 MAG TPA: hypothetical protein [Caudoviricetes sp.]
MSRIANTDRAIKIEEKIKQAIQEGRSKEYIQRLYWSLEKIEYKIDRMNDYSK